MPPPRPPVTLSPKVRRLIVIAALAIVLLFLAPSLSLFYQLDGRKGEQAVIQRFGALVRVVTDPGIHLKLPWPIESCSVVSVSELHNLSVGFRTANERRREYIDEEDHSICITKDQNLVDAEFVVQYQIPAPDRFLFRVAEPRRTVEQVAKAVMRGVIASRNIDDILVGERSQMQIEARDEMQRILDGYEMGVHVVAIQYQDVHAPTPVIEAFSDVQRAREDKETAINEGKRYKNSRIPVAEGQAARVVAEAEAYKVQRLNEARGDASRFTSVVQAYKANPAFVRQQLHLQLLSEVLPQVDKTIVDATLGANLFLTEPSPREPGPEGPARPATPRRAGGGK
jgi:membrane protease subunit HflK